MEFHEGVRLLLAASDRQQLAERAHAEFNRWVDFQGESSAARRGQRKR